MIHTLYTTRNLLRYQLSQDQCNMKPPDPNTLYSTRISVLKPYFLRGLDVVVNVRRLFMLGGLGLWWGRWRG